MQACLADLQQQVERAAAYAESLLRPVGAFCHAHGHAQRATENKKRKRASPFLASYDRDFVEQLSLPGTPTMDLLPFFKGELRHYQLQGVRWLYAMYTAGLASIVADESTDDRTAQIAGLISCMRSKGMCGPVLLVAPTGRHAEWTTQLQQLLGDGVALHTLHDDSPASMQSMQAFCKSAAQLLAQHADTLSVAPSSLVLTDAEVLVREQACLAAQGFKFLVLDTHQADPDSEQEELMQPPSPCGSTAAPDDLQQELPRYAGPTSHLQRMGSMSFADGGQQPVHHARRHSVSFPAGPAPGLPLQALGPTSRNPKPSGAQHGSKLGAGRVHHMRRLSGPITRSASLLGPTATPALDSKPAAGAAAAVQALGEDVGLGAGAGDAGMEEDPGHERLVWSLSRLSSSGDLGEEDDIASGHCVDQTTSRASGPFTRGEKRRAEGGASGLAITRRAHSVSSGSLTAGPFALNLRGAAGAGPVSGPQAGCSRPPRPSTRSTQAAQPCAPPTLTSASSWPLNLAAVAPNASFSVAAPDALQDSVAAASGSAQHGQGPALAGTSFSGGSGPWSGGSGSAVTAAAGALAPALTSGASAGAGPSSTHTHIPPWLAFQQHLVQQQQHALAGRHDGTGVGVGSPQPLQQPQGPITRRRSSSWRADASAGQHQHAAADTLQAAGQQQQHAQACTAADAEMHLCLSAPAAGGGAASAHGGPESGTFAAAMQSLGAAAGQLQGQPGFGAPGDAQPLAPTPQGPLPLSTLQAARAVLKGAGNIVLLAGGDVVAGCGGSEEALWPLLSLLLHTAAEPLQASILQAAQAGVLDGSEAAAGLMAQLRGLVARFVLRRGSGETSLDSLRRQGPECNLYDLFACAD